MITPQLYDDYAAFTATTARYPAAIEKPYLALALADETADELLAAIMNNRMDDAFLELGDGQWYACRLCAAFGLSFAEIVHEAKLRRGHMGSLPCLDDTVLLAICYAGKVAGRVKKHARDGDTWDRGKTEQFLAALRGYLADYVWASMVLIDNLWKINPATGNYDACLQQNAAKLGGRLERGTLRGEGDYR